MSKEEKINTLVEWILNSQYFVMLTGAGISTDSGLADFRGIWRDDIDEFVRYMALAEKLENSEPNAGHLALVELQNLGYLKFIISQNLDNLHLKSGIRDDILV